MNTFFSPIQTVILNCLKFRTFGTFLTFYTILLIFIYYTVLHYTILQYTITYTLQLKYQVPICMEITYSIEQVVCYEQDAMTVSRVSNTDSSTTSLRHQAVLKY